MTEMIRNKKLEDEVLAAVKQCFHDGGVKGPGNHCYFGEPLNESDGERFWTLNYGDTMTLGGVTFPLWAEVVACKEHDAQLEQVFRSQS